MSKVWKIFLYPLMLLFQFGVSIRNFLFNYNIWKSTEFNLPVIAIGNLSVGGTGKTPHSEYLIRLLSSKYPRIALLSRGYKRKTKGFLLADHNASVKTIGDEPYQIQRKFPNIQVAVCEKRVVGIQTLLQLPNPPEMIILDDAFQHRALKAGFYILLTDFKTPFYQDKLLPMGRLREGKTGVERADIIIVTRCPQNLSVYDKKYMIDRIKLTANQLVLFSHIQYDAVQWMFPEQSVELKKNARVLLITGIAHADALLTHLEKGVQAQVEHLRWPDHHYFSQRDLEKIRSLAQQVENKESVLLTTEKDFVRLLDHAEWLRNAGLNFGYFPIQIALNAKDEQALTDKLLHYAKQYKRNR